MRKRLLPTDRKSEILAAALKLASSPGGWGKLTRTSVAQAAGCSDSLVSLHFGTIPNFRRDIMRAAISTKVLPVIAQGLAAGDKHAKKAPDDLKLKALNSLKG